MHYKQYEDRIVYGLFCDIAESLAQNTFFYTNFAELLCKGTDYEKKQDKLETPQGG